MDKTALATNWPDPATISGFSPENDRSWQQELARAWRTPRELLDRLDLHHTPEPRSQKGFPLLVPESFVRRMQPGRLDDPLLQQVLPRDIELEETPGFQADPVADLSSSRQPGLIHKYENRVLLIVSGACAVNCRYCFRRHFPYEEGPRSLEDWEPVLAELETLPQVDEVILSGGDPLTWNDRRLAALIHRLEAVPHLQRLRIHSRLPIVLPNRMTRALLQTLLESRLQPILVVHANHGQEIAADCAEGLQTIVRSGIPTLNQAVLLRGINDSVDAQAELCTRLVNLGVLPYYLNLLDRVQGAAHYEVPATEGRQILAGLRSRLSGYAVPRLVVDIPERRSKTEVTGGESF